MKTFLHYLNWALYDFNQLVWFSFIKPNLQLYSFAIAFFAVSFAPVLIPGITIEIMFMWTIFVIVLFSFLLITYKVYWERRRMNPDEPIVITDVNGDSWSFKPEPPPMPFTIKESAKQGLWWTKYMFGVLIGAFLVSVVCGPYIAEFITYLL